MPFSHCEVTSAPKLGLIKHLQPNTQASGPLWKNIEGQACTRVCVCMHVPRHHGNHRGGICQGALALLCGVHVCGPPQGLRNVRWPPYGELSPGRRGAASLPPTGGDLKPAIKLTK